MGHSVGEYVAACIAGVFSLEEALKLIAARGRLMQALPNNGGMVAILAPENIVRPIIAPYHEQVAIAAFNGPQNLVISGTTTAITQIITQLESQGIQYRQLNVSHAFHSPLMESILGEFEQIAASITYNVPCLTLISNLTGKPVSTELTTPDYWCEHIRQGVNFSQSISTLYQQGYRVFIEIGPKPVLLGMGRFCLNDQHILWLPSIREKFGDWQTLLHSLGQLYIQGIGVNWHGFYQDYVYSAVSLPFYPFQRQRYWWKAAELESAPGQKQSPVSLALDNQLGLLGQKLVLAGTQDSYFQISLQANSPSYLLDHQLRSTVVLPATAYIEMLLAVAKTELNCLSIASIQIEQPLILHEENLSTVQIVFRSQSQLCEIFSIETAKNETRAVRHAHGYLKPTDFIPSSVNLEEIKQDCPDSLPISEYYQELRKYGLNYGKSFQGIKKLWRGEKQALGLIELSEISTLDLASYQAHPALLDACIQVIGSVLEESDLYLPIGLKSLTLKGALPALLWSHIQIKEINNQNILVDVTLFDQTGQPQGYLEELALRRINQNALQWLLKESEAITSGLYTVTWEAQQSEKTAINASPKTWLIFADSQGLGASLAQELAQRGDRSHVIYPGETYSLSEITPDGIIHLSSLDITSDLSQTRNCGSLLELIQNLVKTGISPHLYLVTQGTQAVDKYKCDVVYAQAPLWGLGRVIALEHPQLKCTMIDLELGTNSPVPLLETINAEDKENQIAYRDGIRYVARLTPYEQTQAEAYQLKITEYGILENLTRVPMKRQKPAPGEVEIEVVAAGLNFRDVLNALGLLKAFSEQLGIQSAAEIPFGGECAGRVVAVGEGVTHLQAGDEVIAALAIGSLNSFVITKAEFVVQKPDNLSFEEAATITTAFLTAHYGLRKLAKINQGDRILIHAGAGGVGQAAIQIAQQAGATVYTTASITKWDYLKKMGVAAVFNSRNLDFVQEIRNLTKGRGVDIVLNCLKGEFADYSFSILAEGGRFIEIGKLDIWSEAKVAQERPDVDYFLFDLLEVAFNNPRLIGSMLGEIIQEFAQGTLKPLPHQVFPIKEVVSAFRFMAQAKHIGKVVISFPEKAASNCLSINGNSTYLITGGLGALGLEVAQMLVAQGAKTLVLIGRNAPTSEAQTVIESLKQTSAQIFVRQCDITNREQITEVFNQIQATLPPLKGIIHTAGVLQDALLVNTTWTQFAQVLAPKIQGTWHLHTLSAKISLDFFVCFSSVASLLGSPAQGNYAAANAFMDALAHYRHSQGLPALSINWGPWQNRGMAANLNEASQRRLLNLGMGMIAPETGLEILQNLLQAPTAQIGVLPIDWAKLLAQLPDVPFLTKVKPDTQVQTKQNPEFVRRLKAAPVNERRTILMDFIREQIAKVLGLNSLEEIEPQARFFDLGLDSLMAVELNHLFESNLGYTINQTIIFDYPTVEALVDYLAVEVLNLVPRERETVISLQPPESLPLGDSDLDSLLAELESVSDSEINQRLKERKKG